MKFKLNDVVFITAESLEEMNVPVEDGPLFTLISYNKGVSTEGRPFWILSNGYGMYEDCMNNPTELLKALL